MKILLTYIRPLFATVSLFAIGTLASFYLKDDLSKLLIGHERYGALLFVAMASLAVVIPTFTNVLFIPMGVALFGPFISSLLCILGWWIGSILAFAIGRCLYTWLLKTFPSFQNYLYIDNLIGTRHLFSKLIFLRMTLPVDILSYGIALFSKRVTFTMNAITSFLGIIPFAFLFNYGEKSLVEHLTLSLCVITIIIIAILCVGLYKKSNQLKT